MRLAVNIDHVATVREARKTNEPDPVQAAVFVELAGAFGVTIHLREDRRHINDRDLALLKQTVKLHLNLEMAAEPEVIGIALEAEPDLVTLVPEKREEVTTEGGLLVSGREKQLGKVINKFHKAGIKVSLFIDPDPKTVKASKKAEADIIELHTGSYANAVGEEARAAELKKLVDCAKIANNIGLQVSAGHGLTYQNVQPVAAIPEVTELNIGHSIISRAVLVGLERAVKDMLNLVN
jgi:pyridoxine 5-phosphate synthase